MGKRQRGDLSTVVGLQTSSISLTFGWMQNAIGNALTRLCIQEKSGWVQRCILQMQVFRA